MAKGKRGNYDYDDDDYDDNYDDYDDYDDCQAESKRPKAAASKTVSQAAIAKGQSSSTVPQPSSKRPQSGQLGPAAAAGASKLAQCICDPPPLVHGKLQKGAAKDPAAKAKLQKPFPVLPERNGGALESFKFETPSPDDVVLEAQKGRAGGHQHRPSFITPNPVPPKAPKSSHPPLGIAQPSVPSTGRGGPASSSSSSNHTFTATDRTCTSGRGLASISTAMASLHVGSLSPRSGARGGFQVRPPKRPLSEYKLDPNLVRDVQELESAAGGKPSLHLVVLGHVDAGKSTLMGRLLHELGYVSQRDVHKNQKEASAMGKGSFAWAWVLDERAEERARGVTVDIAMTHFETEGLRVTLLDAPGHRDFVPNMITGAAQADAALLLVDGSPGGFEAGFEGEGQSLGQTREHAQLARSLGVEQLAVVVSKLDVVEYSQDRFEVIKSALLPFLKSCGFKESAVQFLPAVGPTGDNLHKAADPVGLGQWWKGNTVMQAINAFAPGKRNTGLPLRLPIADVFRGRQGGTVVGGKLEAGVLKPGQKVMVVPSFELGTVKSIEARGRAQSLTRAGDSVDVVLTGMDALHLSTGAVVCDPEFPVSLVSKFETRVVVLDVNMPILKGQQVTLHAHTARKDGHISALVSVLNSKTGEVLKTKPRCLTKNQTAVIEVTAPRELCLEEYSEFRALGRVALRDAGRTIAVGIVTKLLS